jgi:hypothetical protein
VPLDDIREELASRVIEVAGRAREAAQRGDGMTAVRALDRALWLEAWERALRRVAERLATRLDTEIDLAGRRARMSRRRRRARLLTGVERRAIGARLASGAGAFVAALDALDEAAERARRSKGIDAAVRAEWADALLSAARRLEAAWLALEDEAEHEAARWLPEIADAAAWRPSLWPVLALGAPLAAVLLWLGLVVGGYLPAPAPLARWLGF